MNRRSLLGLVVAASLMFGCEQLGNPEQYATPPTPWKNQNGHLVTTTRSFTDTKTIRRLVSEGMEGIDYADPSIGPNQALTIVVVVPRSLRSIGPGRVPLVTIFKLEGLAPIRRRWSAPSSGRKWSAAFALPSPPSGAVTSVAP